VKRLQGCEVSFVSSLAQIPIGRQALTYEPRRRQRQRGNKQAQAGLKEFYLVLGWHANSPVRVRRLTNLLGSGLAQVDQTLCWPGKYVSATIQPSIRALTYIRAAFGAHYVQPMKRPLLALVVLVILCGGCSTNYYTYSGSGIYEGTGDASKKVNGIDIWLVGTPHESSGSLDTSPIAGPVEELPWQ
jgi:hypothetical protein